MRNIGLIFMISILGLACNKKYISKHTASEKLILAAVENHNFDYEFYSSKGKINIKSPDLNMGVSTQLRVNSSGDVWLVAKKFGFEVVRGLIVKDTAKVLDRFNKRYAITPINKLEKISGIENILSYINQYVVGNIVVPKTKNKIVEIQDLVSIVRIEDDRSYEYIVNNNDKSLNEISILEDSKLINIKYHNYTTIDQIRVPDNYEITAYENGSEKIKLKINMSSIDLKSNKKMTFEIPKNYNKMNL